MNHHPDYWTARPLEVMPRTRSAVKPYIRLTWTATEPFSFSISPSIADSRDDLPAPTWPTMATSKPSFTSRLMLHKQNEQKHRSYCWAIKDLVNNRSFHQAKPLKAWCHVKMFEYFNFIYCCKIDSESRDYKDNKVKIGQRSNSKVSLEKILFELCSLFTQSTSKLTSEQVAIDLYHGVVILILLHFNSL